MDRNKVILVDKNDNVISEMEKLEAHKQGLLHRAFSVFIFNDNGELLLQQRSKHKYHGGELWTNTCCSHPQFDEDVCVSASERLVYEMGINCSLEFVYSFIYKTEVENNLIEHEYDYVFVGYSNDTPNINKSEVQDFKWMGIEEILEDISLKPEVYTYWFKVALPKIIFNIKNKELLLRKVIA